MMIMILIMIMMMIIIISGGLCLQSLVAETTNR